MPNVTPSKRMCFFFNWAGSGIPEQLGMGTMVCLISLGKMDDVCCFKEMLGMGV